MHISEDAPCRSLTSAGSAPPPPSRGVKPTGGENPRKRRKSTVEQLVLSAPKLTSTQPSGTQQTGEHTGGTPVGHYLLISLFDGTGSTLPTVVEVAGAPPTVIIAAELDRRIRPVIADSVGYSLQPGTW
jgi:hypothetical protein